MLGFSYGIQPADQTVTGRAPSVKAQPAVRGVLAPRRSSTGSLSQRGVLGNGACISKDVPKRVQQTAAAMVGDKRDPYPPEEDIEFILQWAKAKRLRKGNKEPIIISDLFSEDPDDPDGTLQWVNLVMAGGGMLGIAHVGFMEVLELAGVRFLGLGGASAGAINAALTAAVRARPDQMASKHLAQILGDVNFCSFEDGDPYFVKVRKDILKYGVRIKRLLADQLWPSTRNTVAAAYESMGLHKGDEFLRWLKKQMAEHGVSTTTQLLERTKLNGIVLYNSDERGRYQIADVKDWDTGNSDADRHHYPLRIVASEVATQSMAIFPRDADLFYAGDANPADFVRASMSVPVFFKPFCIPYIDPDTNRQYGQVYDAGAPTSERWKRRHDFKGRVPNKAVFCDGGMLSNFPMRLFAPDQPTRNGNPLCPVIGVRLSQDRSESPKIENSGKYLGGALDTTRNILDRDFLFNNPEYAKWVATVDTADFDWLGFDMSPATRARLLQAGRVAAYKFLQGDAENSKVVHLKDGAPGPPAVGSPSVPAAVQAARKLSEWETYKVIKQLMDAAAKANSGQFGEAARTVLLQNLKLEHKYNTDVAPAMELIKSAAKDLGPTWAFGIFMPGFSDDRRRALLDARRITQTFWREVQAAYEPKPGQLQVITDDWWGNNWVGRGREYRLLVEPLDIANWYCNDYHIKSGHYVDYSDNAGNIQSIGNTLEAELTTASNPRPGRYLMLQNVEARAADQDKFGVEHMESSLETARQLKIILGTSTWQQHLETLQATLHHS